MSKRCKTFKTLVPSPRERKFTGKTMAPLSRIDTLVIIWSSILSMHTQEGICRKTTCFSRQNNLRYYLPSVGVGEVVQVATSVSSSSATGSSTIRLRCGTARRSSWISSSKTKHSPALHPSHQSAHGLGSIGCRARGRLYFLGRRCYSRW